MCAIEVFLRLLRGFSAVNPPSVSAVSAGCYALSVLFGLSMFGIPPPQITAVSLAQSECGGKSVLPLFLPHPVAEGETMCSNPNKSEPLEYYKYIESAEILHLFECRKNYRINTEKFF